ncbi:TIGR03619 family F420-dependent LLM class oxidoreductase [Jatrophihabitans telluris]|uniref:TIGR03619 family F420-dependent LLM class oxidoreductase n=1 Tax=Jatrophihabitans telluris TaxID=2038343 RepID=A0ABY4R2N4_9ACTN|nr:TIGR03619 family F420-dependent LLM class oxidoreductase [Jatrophihabitans telluris]UQX89792.1 TIGR03619 family F420-dependent LLM class oxidoreductase [Jatrophihabitans telluris]
MTASAATSCPKLGFGLPVSGSWARRDNLAEIARLAEEAGYASLWTFQRLLYPERDPMGPMYRSVADPLTTLAFVAALTSRARLGVAIVNAPFYSPVMLAKQLATIDELSEGRLDAGLGLGWVADEFVASGVPMQRRGARLDEFLECLKAVWTTDVVEFEGEFYRIPRSYIDPKPVQRPHPPILLGGDAEAALRRVGRVADGWITRSRHDLRRIPEDLRIIRDAASQAGRDPDAIRVIVRGVLRLSETRSDDNEGRPQLTGTARQIMDDLELLGAQGVDEVFIDLNFVPEIGDPSAEADSAMNRAVHVLETFAPAR